MLDFIITSEGGRIGGIWCFDNVTMPRLIDAAVFGVLIRAVLWGTFGVGRDVVMRLKAIKTDSAPEAA